MMKLYVLEVVVFPTSACYWENNRYRTVKVHQLLSLKALQSVLYQEPTLNICIYGQHSLGAAIKIYDCCKNYVNVLIH